MKSIIFLKVSFHLRNAIRLYFAFLCMLMVAERSPLSEKVKSKFIIGWFNFNFTKVLQIYLFIQNFLNFSTHNLTQIVFKPPSFLNNLGIFMKHPYC